MEIISKTQLLKDLPHALRLVCGTDAVVEDVAARQLAAHDIFFQSPQLPQFILYPRSSATLASAMSSIHCAGLAVAPRGGGMSYTGGYLPEQAYACIDLSRMSRVVEVNTQDLYITLEAGCTWAQVRDTLSGSGYTTPYAGPLSGLRATVGGALSQNSMFFGAGQHGSAAESVLSLSVVLANGELLHTGSAGFSGASPFARWGGPDLTGLFLGDAGAMGIKAQATLRLIPAPASQGYASFGFPTLADMVGAQIDLMRQGLGSECFGIDAFKAVHSAQTGNKLATGLQTLSQVTRSAPDLISGLKSAASLALTGTQYLAVHPYSIHLALDGDNQALVDLRLARVAQIAVAHQGVAQPASVPTVLRAQPFQPLRSVLGYNGDPRVPVHGIVPLSKAQEVVRSIETLITAHAKEMQTHNIVYSPLTANLDRAFLFEPCFYWPDEILPIHVDVLGTSLTAAWQQRPPSPAAHTLVSQLWTEVTQCLDSFGAVHFQHGRAYPYLQRLQPSTRQLVLALKRALDPQCLMNPGSLGLAEQGPIASEFAASS